MKAETNLLKFCTSQNPFSGSDRRPDRTIDAINGQTIHCETDRLIFCNLSLRRYEQNTNETVSSPEVRLMSLIFRLSGCFYGYIGWRRGWRAGVRHGVCHGAVVLVAYVQARAQVKGMTLTRAYQVLPLTALRERTAESAPNTVSRKKVVLYRSHLRHTSKHGKNNIVDCKVSFYTKFLLTYWSETSASISTHYCDVRQNLYFQYWNSLCVRNTKKTL